MEFRLNPDSSPQPIQNLLTNCQSNPGPFELTSPVQPLKNHENSFEILGVDSHAIVPYGKDPILAAIFCGSDVYARLFDAAIFDRIANEILKHEDQLHFIRGDRWQRIE